MKRFYLTFRLLFVVLSMDKVDIRALNTIRDSLILCNNLNKLLLQYTTEIFYSTNKEEFVIQLDSVRQDIEKLIKRFELK